MTADRGTSRRGWWLAAAACALLAAGGGAYWWWQGRPPEPPEIPLEGADREVAEAITEAREEVRAKPRSAEAWGLLGRVLITNEIHTDATVGCFAEAERLDPKNPRWPYFQGATLLNLLRREEAALKLARAAELAERTLDGHPTPALLLAETLVAGGRRDDAEQHFRDALADDADNPRAHFGLALLEYHRGRWQKCRGHLEAALGSPQSRKRAAAQLAAVCQRLGDLKSADHYAALEARLPKDLPWYDPYVIENAPLARRKRDRYRAVENLEAAGRHAQAAEILSRLAQQYPDDFLPHIMLGRVVSQLGQYDLAERHLLRARELSPDTIQAHYLLALVLFKRGETLAEAKDGDPHKARQLFEQSAASARKVLDLKPDYGFAHMALGLALKGLGRKQEAAEALRLAVHCNPEFSDNHLLYGVTLAEAGQMAEARPHLEQARLLAGANDPRPAAALERFFPKNGTNKMK